jgi:hypothetical protein
VDVSGTKMRQFIDQGDQESFARNMPKGVNAKAIWDILSKSAQEEKTDPQPGGKSASKKASAAVPTQKAKPIAKTTKKKTIRSEAIDLIKSFIIESIRTS